MINLNKYPKTTRLGGLNNTNILLESENFKYVLRIPSSENKNDFNKEHYVLTFASLNKLSPPIIYHNERNGILISNFLEDSKLSFSQFTSYNFLEKLSLTLKKFHNLTVPFYFNPFNLIRENLDFLRENNFEFPIDIGPLLYKLNILEDKLNENKLIGLCHNDLNSSNVLYYNEKAYLIDFEFSAMGDIFFDLATLSWMLDEKERYFLLKSYFGYYSKSLMNRINDYLFVVKLWNASWSFIKSLNSDSTYDYKLGGNMILDDLYINYLS